MPIYVYQHKDDPDGCPEPLEIFQHMKDDHLAECPVCNKSIFRVISSPNFAVKNATPGAKELAQWEYGLKRGEQGYMVPKSGEVIRTEGMTKREKQVAIWQGHQRADDPATRETGPESVEVIGD